MPPAEALVLCNGCTACCRADALPLYPEHGDDPADYDCELGRTTVRGERRWMLRRQANGDCVYLDRESGCTIHERRPSLCRSFDCRAMYVRLRDLYSEPQRKRLIRRGVLSREVLRAARERLGTL